MYNSINREIKGYVEALYDVKKLSEKDFVAISYFNEYGRPVQLTPFEYGKTKDDILSTPRVINNYSILYENYIKLDGSFVLFNKFDNNCGFITIETPQEIYDNNYQEGLGFDAGYVIIKLNIKEGMNGITFYFKDNTIKNAQIKLYKSGSQEAKIINIENNEDEVVFIDIDDTYNVFNMTIYEWTKPTHVMQWIRVDLGLSKIYKGEELIEFTVTEQVDKLCEESPNNELSLTIGDYDRLYDPLNPTGITKYLTENCVYIPHIGIVNEYGGIIYTKMGEFYFFQNDYKDKEVTITAYNLMYKLNEGQLRNNKGYLFCDNGDIGLVNQYVVERYLREYIGNEYNLEYNVNLELENAPEWTYVAYVSQYIDFTKFTDYILYIIIGTGIFFVDRDNKINIVKINNNIVETITKNELLKDISYIKINKIDKVTLNYSLLKSEEISTSSEPITQLNQSFTLNKDVEVFCITTTNYSLTGIKKSDLTYTGCDDIKIISRKNNNTNEFKYKMYVEVTGKKGNNVTISLINNQKIVFSNNQYSNAYGTGSNELSFTGTEEYTLWRAHQPYFAQHIMDLSPSYSVSLDYNGNPNIKAGDYIEVESNYGMVKLFVTKHTLTYSGGLSGSIEGVE